MVRILRNTSRVPVATSFNRKEYKIKSKGTLTVENEKVADYLLQTYGFLRDITPKNPVKKLPVRKTFGRPYVNSQSD